MARTEEETQELFDYYLTKGQKFEKFIEQKVKKKTLMELEGNLIELTYEELAEEGFGSMEEAIIAWQKSYEV